MVSEISKRLSRRPHMRIFSRPTIDTNMSLSSAFTLIELLVVISIVALLASVLMPAISMVRELALDVRCKSSLRQLGIGVHALALDYEGTLLAADGINYPLAPESGVADCFSNPVNIYQFSDNGNFDASTDLGFRSNSWWPVWIAGFVGEDPMRQTQSTRLGNSVTFGCPVWRRTYQKAWFDNPRWRECSPGYGMPSRINNRSATWRGLALTGSWPFSTSDTARETALRRSSLGRAPSFNGIQIIGSIPKHAEVPIFLDNNNHVSIENYFGNYTPSMRHRGKANAVMLDGRVSSILIVQRYNPLNAP